MYPVYLVALYEMANTSTLFRLLGCERVYLPLHKVADTPFSSEGTMTLT